MRPGEIRVRRHVEALEELRSPVILEDHGERQEEHVGDRVLQTRRDEQRDRPDDGERLVDERLAGERHPHREADREVREDAEDERLTPRVMQLGSRAVEDDLAPPVLTVRLQPTEVAQRRDEQRADEVEHPHDHPVQRELGPRDASNDLGDDRHRRGREQLRARHDDEQQADGERDAANGARDAPRHRRRARLRRDVEDKTERDPCAAQHGEHGDAPRFAHRPLGHRGLGSRRDRFRGEDGGRCGGWRRRRRGRADGRGGRRRISGMAHGHSVRDGPPPGGATLRTARAPHLPRATAGANASENRRWGRRSRRWT